ncbi:serine/threonine protein kinase [Planctomicrobium piriforme]|uniref:Serine/threonine protein kinase n=1 Tax=Planctomicrobium piriforme TaxID=1576369 RepID=A0A1I3QH40_9PLAN|nr:serine/threonine protein kinase [Planctomicrobium piriforme]SFJ32677.1 Serine/threonine protein kinase [Planctomicrobium piriforme]
MSRPFGPYDIVEELGRGAMGVVFLAVHRSLQRECALKTIALKLKDPPVAERFIREGQAVARLGKHPNIVQVFDAGIVDGTPYIAMEFVEGETLESLSARSGPFIEPELIEIGSKLALALDHAHRRGIVHRDVKPANIIIDLNGEPQLLDFGISKDLNASTAPREEFVSPKAATSRTDDSEIAADETGTATVVLSSGNPSPNLDEGIQGTPAFMAPEQADPRRGPVNACSDVYALATTLYVLATARRPFEAATITDLLVRIVTEQPAPLHHFVEISPDLEAVILKALEKEPHDRYQTALEFADDLSRVTMGLPTHARKLGKLGWLWRRFRAYSKFIVIAAAFLVFTGIISTYFLLRSREIQVLWDDIAERTARASAQEVRSLLDPALPMLEECAALAEMGLLPVNDPELLAQHFVARFRYQKKLSWLSYGDAQGRFTGVWRNPSGRIVIQRSWIDAQGGHIREEFADGDHERLRWSDDWKYDPRTRPFYELAAAARVPIWTKPYEWFGGEGLGITSALAWREAGAEHVRGVFTADYHLSSLADFLANLKVGKHGQTYLLGRGGALLASPERGATAPDALLSTAMQRAETALPGGISGLTVDEPVSFSFQHTGRPYIAALEAFQPAAGLPIVTVVLVPEDDVTGPTKAAAVRTVNIGIGIAVLAVLATLLAGLFQKRRLIKQLKQRRRELREPPTSSSTIRQSPASAVFEETQVTQGDS